MKQKSDKATTSERLVHIRLKADTHRRLRIQVAEEDTSIQEWVSALIERGLDRLDVQKAEDKDV